MLTMARTSLLPYLSPVRLLGPLADKELRVASRRRRSYVLRSGYLVLLCVLMLSTWYSMMGMPSGSLAAFGTSRAAVVSTWVAMTVTQLQVVAAQLIAALMLSSSIGDEMRRGTLGVLLTTPITSRHIVAGKLLSGLLQVLLLLAISLPALAVLRVLGGLSWGDIVAVSCITLTAAMFAGALELLLSTYYHQPYQAISAGAVVYVILFAGLPFAVSCLGAAGGLNPPTTQSLLDVMNPFRALYRVAPWTLRHRTAMPSPFFSWPVHCLIMAGAAGVLALVSVWRIRPAAVGGLLRARGEAGGLRCWYGSLLPWRDGLHGRRWGTRTILTGTGVLVLCILIGATSGPRNAPVMLYPHYAVRALWPLAFLRLAISVAGDITREKESGAWQVLLTTPLPEGRILWVKAMGALRRNAGLLLSLLAIQMCSVLFQVAPGKEMTAAIVGLFRLGSVFFILGAGLYFGVRLRTTTLAVAATMIVFLCVNYLLAGSYNPLFALLWTRVIPNVGPWGNYLMVFYYLATMGAALVLDIALGLFLWRRARQNVRLYVF